jgi:hypothetical protein
MPTIQWSFPDLETRVAPSFAAMTPMARLMRVREHAYEHPAIVKLVAAVKALQPTGSVVIVENAVRVTTNKPHTSAIHMALQLLLPDPEAFSEEIAQALRGEVRRLSALENARALQNMAVHARGEAIAQATAQAKVYFGTQIEALQRAAANLRGDVNREAHRLYVEMVGDPKSYEGFDDPVTLSSVVVAIGAPESFPMGAWLEPHPSMFTLSNTRASQDFEWLRVALASKEVTE